MAVEKNINKKMSGKHKCYKEQKSHVIERKRYLDEMVIKGLNDEVIPELSSHLN